MGAECSIDLSNLSVGQVFKNLQELSLHVLGYKLPSGKGRSLKLSYMKQFFSWDKIPGSQKIIITEIYSNRLIPLHQRSKYAPLIYDSLCNYNKELIFTKTELLHILGIVNDNFHVHNFIATANELQINYKVLKIITTDIYTLLSSMLSKSLNQLESHGYINLKKNKKIIYINEHSPLVTPETIDRIYKEVQHELSCNNYFEVIKSNILPEYTSLCNQKLNTLGVKRVANVYEISLLKPSLPSQNKSELNILCKNFLLKHYHNNHTAIKIIDYYTSISTEGV